MSVEAVLALIGAALAGAVAAWLLLRFRRRDLVAAAKSEAESRNAVLGERLAASVRAADDLKTTTLVQGKELTELRTALTAEKVAKTELETRLSAERDAAQEKMALLDDARAKLADAFKALSSEALQSNNSQFLDLASATLDKYQESARTDIEQKRQAVEQLVGPVREALEKFDRKVLDLEKEREGAYQGLREQVKSLVELQVHLQKQTSQIARALGTPQIRGRWGEIQLKRVVEIAGMIDHCDFYEQREAAGDEGRLRPDMLIRLPGGKNVVVDAKAPLSAYLEAIEATDEAVRQAKMADYARSVRAHLGVLSRKSYWEQFQPAPEFVVMFLPGEPFFSAALEQDPALIEFGVEQRVILSTPTTLIALLKAIAYGWRQEMVAENATQIIDLGKDLYKRVTDMSGHFADLGRNLGRATESFNRAVGSLESRVLVSARRFRDLQAPCPPSEIETVGPVETVPRRIQAAEMACPEPEPQPEAVTGQGEEDAAPSDPESAD